MAKLITNLRFKAIIEDFFIYPLYNMMIMRKRSGFTKETRTTEAKYENCTRSANEFGRVSSACGQIRLALKGTLPKENNLAVVNSFTKKMREVLECDYINVKGERVLANALLDKKCRQMLQGYEFNPDTTISFDYALTDNSLNIVAGGLLFPKGKTQIGFRVHRLAFDFTTAESKLVSGDWYFEKGLITLDLPTLSNYSGVAFTILEAEYFNQSKGGLIPIKEDGEKRVTIIAVTS